MLSDEIYEKITYDNAEHVSLASLSPEIYDLTITVNGFSKAYAMTGWRLGYVAAPEPIAAAIDSIQSHSTSNPTSFAQKGALAALKGDQSFIAEMVKAFAERRAYMYDRLRRFPGITCVMPMGAFYMLPNISSFGLTRPISAPSCSNSRKSPRCPASRSAPMRTCGSATPARWRTSRKVSTASKRSARV